MKKKKKLGFALGCGGSRGVAHHRFFAGDGGGGDPSGLYRGLLDGGGGGSRVCGRE